MPVDPALAAVILASAMAAALLAAALLFLPVPGRAGRAGALAADEGISLLFDGQTLIDATPEGRALLSGPALRGSPWDRLRAALAPHFPELDAALLRLPAEGSILLAAPPGGAGRRQALRLDLVGGLTRLRLATPKAEITPSLDAYFALTEELDTLREILAAAPFPIWRETAAGGTTWANTAYLQLAAERLEPGEDLIWPLPALFAAEKGLAGRQRFDIAGAAPKWFDLDRRPGAGDTICLALPADAVQKAETAMRDFMQTLVRSFAYLPVALAIFDSQRQLHLFNPAFLDLTGLPVDFLSGRPKLAAVLDALRDRNMIPEPKDYRAWRKRMADLERTGIAETHEETWSLSGGQTYRVSARSHSDGGVALMIEDISTEMTRTRRYRADLELGQSVIDALGEGIAVFSAAGQLVMSNEAYGALWGHDPSPRLVEADVVTLSAHWRDLAPPTPVWRRIEEFVSATVDRAPWSAEVRLLDGRLVGCRAAPLAGGASLVAFRALVPGDATRGRGPDPVALSA